MGAQTLHRPRNDPRQATVERPWFDLAAQRPGAMARARAAALRDDRPLRTGIARAVGVHTEERAWRMGAAAEERVGRELEQLAQADPRWRVLHALPVGGHGGDIDHLAIGPGGVFTVHATPLPGTHVWVRGMTFKVDGYTRPDVHAAVHEASRAARLLARAGGRPPPVTGLVVPVGVASLVVTRQPQDAQVVSRQTLRDWLCERPVRLTAAEADAVHALARRSDTWWPAG